MREESRLTAVVLISGGGSNLQAFIDAVAEDRLYLDLAAVISNRPGAFGLERAADAGIPAACIDHEQFTDREAFDAALAEAVGTYRPDIIILAGFMRILSREFVNRFEGRILNIHPSLLPKFRGLGTHQRAIDAGESWHGATVHFVSAELDGGPPIIQGRVPILPGDDAKTLAARVLEIEHLIYPEAVRLIQAGRVTWRDHRAWLDGQPLDEPILYRSPEG